MNFAGWITLIYGLLILIGGIMGHIKAQSRISLLTGVVFGTLLLLSSWALFKGMKVGVYASLVLTVGLLAVFIWRYSQTFKIFPPLIMGIVSAITLVLLLVNLKSHL